MRRLNHTVGFISLLLLIVITGCSDPDTTPGGPGLTPPTVISVAPPNNATGACSNTIVTATFTEAMNPATINASTFTLTGPNSGAVAGQVTYNSTSNTAIFTPSSSLGLSTLYTATITTASQGSVWQHAGEQ